MEYLWATFQRLSAFRDYDMDGPRRLSPMQIHYGLLIYGERFTARELDALSAIDRAWLYEPEIPTTDMDEVEDD